MTMHAMAEQEREREREQESSPTMSAGRRDRDRQFETLRLLRDVSRRCGEPGGIDEIAPIVVRRLCSGAGFHVGRLFMSDVDADADAGRVLLLTEHVAEAARPLYAGPPAIPCRVDDAADPAVRAVLAGADTQCSIAPVHADDGRVGDRAEFSVVVAVRDGDRIAGALQCSRPTRPRATDSLCEMLESVGEHLGRVVERERLQRAAREAAEQERERLSRMLRATSARGLAGVVAAADRAQRELGGGESPAETPDAVARAVTAVSATSAAARRALEDFRTQLDGLAPPAFGRGGFAGALDELASSFEACHALECEVRCDAPVEDPGIASELLLIVAEAVSNAARHGQAQHLRVAVTPHGAGTTASIVLEVRDDGVGLTPQAMRAGGTGLALMRLRASAIGGRLSVTSVPGRGTTVRCSVPAGAGRGSGQATGSRRDAGRPAT